MNCTKESLLLYLVTDRHWLEGRRLYDDVRAALDGGVTFVQVREEDDMEMDHDSFFAEAKELKELCRAYHVPFIVDNDVDLALELDCDGVHVGQDDMEAGEARKKLGPDKILGVSARTVDEAVLAEKNGADYLGVGAVFHTGSKADARAISHETLKDICAAVSIPVIAIGGVTKENVYALSGTGICGVAVISAILAKKDVRRAAEELKAATCRTLGIF